jgi:BirA family biotin operon repressor/biotin-[acetyl-CoA-carboxylase] ligase
VAVVRTVDSTNLLARRIRTELAEDDLPLPWSALLAFEQTAGRGRGGRSWASPPGMGVYATVLGRLGERARLPVLSLGVGVTLAEALDRFAPGRVRLKWPNDLMLDGRKVGGVLVEAITGPTGEVDVLAGFGINHGQGEAELPVPAATSLAVAGVVPPLAELACTLVEAVGTELSSHELPEHTVARWLERTQHREGDLLRCRVPGGELTGGFLGLTGQGLLRLDVAGRETLVATGEVEG